MSVDDVRRVGSARCPSVDDVRRVGSARCPSVDDVRRVGSVRCPSVDDVRSVGSVRCPSVDVVRRTGSVRCLSGPLHTRSQALRTLGPRAGGVFPPGHSVPTSSGRGANSARPVSCLTPCCRHVPDGPWALRQHLASCDVIVTFGVLLLSYVNGRRTAAEV